MVQPFFIWAQCCYCSTEGSNYILSSFIFSSSVVPDEFKDNICLYWFTNLFHVCLMLCQGNVLNWVVFGKINCCVSGFNKSRTSLTSSKNSLLVASTWHDSWSRSFSVTTWTGKHIFRLSCYVVFIKVTDCGELMNRKTYKK